MKQLIIVIMTVILALALASCGISGENTGNIEVNAQKKEKQAIPQGNSSRQEPAPANKILIAYFSRVGNTDFPEDIDAVASASLLLKNGELYGNTQYIASLIQQQTGGDLFLIQTEEKYPADYDETDMQGQQENRNRPRPALAAHVENMDDYDLVFLGFPNWYYDMPMAVYTFLEEYDLAGKTIIPFVTSGGGGFSNAIPVIQELQPDAEVLADGYKVSHSKAGAATLADIEEWINSLPIN